MANLTSVGVTSGVPSSGTGTVSTIDQLLAAGVPISNGSSSVQAALTGASSAPTSSMTALVVGLSPNSVNANGQATMANSAPVVIASNQTSVSVSLSSAINQLWNPGTGFNGLLANVITLMSTEMVSLASSGVTLTSTEGASGVFTSSYTGQAVLGEVFLTIGTTATTVAGANYAGWFMASPDGTTFESTANVPLARAPDFVIPLPTATLGASLTYKAAGLVSLPALNFKVMVQNNMGIITGSSSGVGNPLLKLAPIAQQGG